MVGRRLWRLWGCQLSCAGQLMTSRAQQAAAPANTAAQCVSGSLLALGEGPSGVDESMMCARGVLL
jgi:hypothetical protein